MHTACVDRTARPTFRQSFSITNQKAVPHLTLTLRRGHRAVLAGALATTLLVAPAAAQDLRTADSLDPSLASIEVSASTFGPGTVDTLVVGRNDDFADNLGGSALAGTVGGPLLLTDGGPDAPIRQEVLEEINTLLAPNAGPNCDDQPADVYILGGPNAVSAAAAEEIGIQGWCVERLEGPSRVETSVVVAQVIEGRTNGNVEAMVARSDNFADSAAAGAYGARFNVPILVTQGTALHPAVRDFLFARDITFFDRVTLLGGTGALSQGVEEELRANAPDPASIVRISGSTRDETSVAIANEYQVRGGGTASVGLVNGFFPDGWVYALTGGAAASVTDAPLVYVQTDSIPDGPFNYLYDNQPSTIITFGPTDLVSDEVAAMARHAADQEVD